MRDGESHTSTTTFYNRIWLERISEKPPDFQSKWPKLSPYIPKDEGAVILDFGCGYGFIMQEMQAINPKAKYIGLDVSEVALAKASASLPWVEFHKIVDGEPFPIKDEQADFIFSSEVIEHVYDTENAFSEMARVLRPGGQLLITTPYHGFVKNLLIVFYGFDRHFDPTGFHVRFFSKRSLTSCLRKVGFKVLREGYFGRFYPIPHCIFLLAEKVKNEY